MRDMNDRVICVSHVELGNLPPATISSVLFVHRASQMTMLAIVLRVLPMHSVPTGCLPVSMDMKRVVVLALNALLGHTAAVQWILVNLVLLDTSAQQGVRPVLHVPMASTVMEIVQAV